MDWCLAPLLWDDVAEEVLSGFEARKRLIPTK